jgi:hypothetical protein
MLMADVPTYDKEILPIVLPSIVEAENVSDRPRIYSMQQIPSLEANRVAVSQEIPLIL